MVKKDPKKKDIRIDFTWRIGRSLIELKDEDVVMMAKECDYTGRSLIELKDRIWRDCYSACWQREDLL